MSRISAHMLKTSLPKLGMVGMVMGASLVAAPALAQDSAKPTDISPPILNLSDSLSGALDALQSDALDLDLDATLALESCRFGQACPGAIGYTEALSAGSLIGLDFELQPRASFRTGDETSTQLGGTLRIGDDLGAASKSWYLFAGADAETLDYTPNRFGGGFGRTDYYGNSDRLLVGDAQAGIGYRLGDADVSLGYYHRQVSPLDDVTDATRSENTAAISFTWKR